jgi:hypothetical protein
MNLDKNRDVVLLLERIPKPMKYTFLFICTVALLNSCKVHDPEDPHWIIDQAIEKAGGSRFLTSTIEFDFRDRHYIAKRNQGMYSYQRIFIDTTNTTYHDFLSNDGFTRKVNDEIANLPDTTSAKYARSTNSVIYFALLPYGLNDDAVNKEYIGETIIEDQLYQKIKITFGEEGGGEDHDDVFIYWIHKEKSTVDYLGYSYHTDGGGVRFRKAIDPRMVDGILFQDYINYKPKDESIAVEKMEALFVANELEELSRIELKNIQVQIGVPADL